MKNAGRSDSDPRANVTPAVTCLPVEFWPTTTFQGGGRYSKGHLIRAVFGDVKKRNHTHGLARRICGGILCVVFACAVIGIPIPVSPQGMLVSDEDFPCRDHNCGCLNAEMCRTSCCCAIPSVDAEIAESCCKGGSEDCSDAPGACEEASDSDAQVAVIRALSCRGLTLDWVMVGVVLEDAADIRLPAPAPAGCHPKSNDKVPQPPIADVPYPPPRART